MFLRYSKIVWTHGTDAEAVGALGSCPLFPLVGAALATVFVFGFIMPDYTLRDVRKAGRNCKVILHRLAFTQGQQ